jgi:hypothetical protein
MQTLTSEDIDYVSGSFRAWCTANNQPKPSLDQAFAYFSYVQEYEPYVAELIDGDWDDFVIFLRERKLLAD